MLEQIDIAPTGAEEVGPLVERNVMYEPHASPHLTELQSPDTRNQLPKLHINIAISLAAVAG